MTTESNQLPGSQLPGSQHPDEIEESMRLAREQASLEVGTRLVDAEEAAAEEVFNKARRDQEAELGQLPEKYRGKSAAEVYALLQKEMEYKASKESSQPVEDAPEGAPEEGEVESPAEEETEAFTALREASEEFYANDGKLNEETISKLEALPSADLIKAWQDLQADSPAPPKPLSDEDALSIVKSVGGQEAYNKALSWAADNLSDDDKTSYDQVISSGNKAATRFAVEALLNRYKAAEGFDGEPVSGGKVPSNSRIKPYRSNAELRRDLSNSRYQQDPAFRLDVEERLSVSGELL